MAVYQMQVVLNEKKCEENGYDYLSVQHFLNKSARSAGLTNKVSHATWRCGDDLALRLINLANNLVDIDWLNKMLDHVYVWEKEIDDDHREDAIEIKKKYEHHR